MTSDLRSVADSQSVGLRARGEDQLIDCGDFWRGGNVFMALSRIAPAVDQQQPLRPTCLTFDS